MWQASTYYIALAFKSLLGIFGVRLYEEPRYEVIDRVADRVEIRRYGARVAAEAQVAIAGEAGNNEAFKLLFAYIAGANQAASSGDGKIAMTVPVEVRDNALVAMTVPVQTSQKNGGTVMRFRARRRGYWRCSTVREMKEGPSGSAIRSLIPSHRKLLWSKAMVGSVAETSGR